MFSFTFYAAVLVASSAAGASATALSAPASACVSGWTAEAEAESAAAESPAVARMASCTSLSAIGSGCAAAELAALSGLVFEKEGRPLSMLSEYTELLTQYTEFAETMAAYNGDNLSAADYAYYIEVMGRVSQKLLELT